MKKLLALFLLAGIAYGQSVQQSLNQLGTTNNWVITFSWTAASNGTIPATPAGVAGCCIGYFITQVETVPGSPSPTSGYSLAMKDAAGVDVLGGAAASLSASTAQSFSAASTATPIQGNLTLVISGQSVSGAQGVVYVFLSKPGTFNTAKLFQGSGGSGSIASVFGRTGSVIAQSGDYTTTQVTEAGNLYFTAARAQAAMAGLYQSPIVTGATSQYFRGDLSLAAFPSIPTVLGGACTNQAATAISTSAVPTCTTLTSAYVDTSIAKTGADINTSNQVTATHLATALPVAQGGSGTTTPALVAGTNVTISGTWPNQTINSSATSGGYGGIINGPATLTCNGSTDTTTAFNTLLGVAGGIITLGPHLNCVVTNLVVSANAVTLDCAGSTLTAKAATSGYVLHGSGISNFTLRNCTIDGSNITTITDAIEFDSSTNITITQNTVQNVDSAGSMHFGNGIHFFSTSGEISNNQTTSIAGFGIFSSGGAAAGLDISGNRVVNSSKGGIYVFGSSQSNSKATITNNYVDGCYDAGADNTGAYGNCIDLFSSIGGVVANNSIWHSEYSGIRLSSASGSTVTGNDTHWTGDWAIYSEFVSGASTIAGNTALDMSGGGIDVANSADNSLNWSTTVSGNTVRNCYGSSDNGEGSIIWATGIITEKFTTATGNTIDGCAYAVQFSGNALVNGAQGNMAAGNLILDSRPFTVTLSAPYTGTIAQGDTFYVGGSYGAATKRGEIDSVVSTTKLNVRMTRGRLANSDVITDLTQTGSGTVSGTPAGPQITALALSSLTNIHLFDVVTAGSGATQSQGIVVCLPVIGLACTAGHIVVGVQENASGLMVPFPGSGTLTDVTSGAAPTITGTSPTDISLNTCFIINNNDTIANDVQLVNNRCFGQSGNVYAGYTLTTTSLSAVPQGVNIAGVSSVVAFASLPACSSDSEGLSRPVQDSSTSTWGATITGSSTNHVLAYCDGTNWTVAAK